MLLLVQHMAVKVHKRLVQNSLKSEARFALALLSLKTDSELKAQAEITGYLLKPGRFMSTCLSQQGVQKAETYCNCSNVTQAVIERTLSAALLTEFSKDLTGSS